MTNQKNNKVYPLINRGLKGIYGERAGVSMLIGLGLVFVILFFGLIVGNIVTSSIRQASNVSRSNEAYFGAEGALERGLLTNYQLGAGQYHEEAIPYSTTLQAGYEVQGQVPEALKYGSPSDYANMYGVPTPGTGNVGLECDPLEPVIEGTYFVDSVQYDEPADHPCNWNKIKVGETVAIPLYYVDVNGPHNLFTDQNQEFKLRVRTPCSDGSQMCSDTTRFSFNISDTADPPIDDPILTWQILAKDSNNNNETITLGPYLTYNSSDELRPMSTIVSEQKLITAGFSDHVVMKQDTYGIDINNCAGFIYELLLDQFGAVPLGSCDTADKWTNHQLVEPIMKFSLIGEMENTLGEEIPYLEYQLITSDDLDSNPTDTSQTITAEGISGTFKQVLEVKQPQAGGLPEYVIQQ